MLFLLLSVVGGVREREASHPAVVIIIAAVVANITAAASAPPRRCATIPQDTIQGDAAAAACVGAMGRSRYAGRGGRGATVRGGGGRGVAILHDGEEKRGGSTGGRAQEANNLCGLYIDVRG